jgi:hypothetical protein
MKGVLGTDIQQSAKQSWMETKKIVRFFVGLFRFRRE